MNLPIDFVGAGPGALDLITVRAERILRAADTILYAGSLIPEELVGQFPQAECIDSATMHLDEIMTIMISHCHAGKRVVRLHSGDPSIYGAINEQCRRLRAEGIEFVITPGVPAFAAAAAQAQMELTLPAVSQSILLTRTATRSSPMPDGEELATLAACAGTLVFHLSITKLAVVIRELRKHRSDSTPIVVAYRVSWDDQLMLYGTLADIHAQVKAHKLTRTALIMVGDVFAAETRADAKDSLLYAQQHKHLFRDPTPALPVG